MAQVRPPAPGRSVSAHGFESKLSQQLAQPHQTDLEHQLEPSRSPKSRSLSDASRPTPTQPSTGDLSRSSKDDTAIPILPATPRRSSVAHSSLSLNLPSKPAASPSLTNRAPLSPKLDPSHQKIPRSKWEWTHLRILLVNKLVVTRAASPFGTHSTDVTEPLPRFVRKAPRLWLMRICLWI
jgi:hypothetical protein